MNTINGNLKDYSEILGDGMFKMTPEQQMDALKKQDYIPIDNEDMTMKQKETKQVSLKDHRSTLGKQLTAIQQRKKVFGR